MPEVRASLIIQAKDEFSGPADKAGKAGQGLNKSFGDAFQSMTGLNLASVSLAGGIGAVAAGIKASIDFTTRWGDEIDELSRITGTSAAETSKLAVVLGDMGISTDTLRGAAKALKNEGLVPNLETLKELARQYQAIQDPVERTRFGIKNLGRSYFELSEFLTRDISNIDALGEAAERSGKIIDEAGIAKAEEYSDRLRQLGDRVDGLKLAIGGGLIPVLLQAGDALDLLLTGNQQIAAALQEHEGEVLGTAESYEAYRNELLRANEAAGKVIAITDEFGNAQGYVTDQTNILTEAQFEARRVALILGDARAEAIAQSREHVIALNEELTAEDELKLAEQQRTQSLKDLQLEISGPVGKANEDFIQQQAEMRIKARDLQGEIDTLNGKQYLTGAQKEELENLRTQLGDTEAALVKNADAHDEATKRIMFDLLVQRAGIDELSDAEIDFLNDTALKWGLVDQATHDAVEAIDGALGDLATGNIKDAQAAVNDLVGYIEKIPRTVNVDINVSTHGAAGEIGLGGEAPVTITPEKEPAPIGGKFQAGGAFTIPPGFPNDTFYLGAGHYGSSGEKVSVMPPGAGEALGGQMAALLAALQTMPRQIARGVRDGLQLASV